MAPTLVVIHPGALGDVLLAVPALSRLRAQFSEQKCLLIANESIGRFLQECGLIDAWASIQRADVTGLFVGQISDSNELMAWLQACTVAVGWMNDEHQTIENALKHCGVREVRIRSPFAQELKSTHQSDRFMEAIGDTGIHLSAEGLIRIPEDSAGLGQTCLARYGIVTDRPIVMVHPGSGSRSKCIKPEILAFVVEQLQSEGTQVLLLEGPADHEAVMAVRHRMCVHPTVVSGVDLSTVAGLLAHVRVFIGHDSGITHLAGLLGVPTLALFGPTDSDRWAPRGPHIAILRGAPCTCSSWECVTSCTEKPCMTLLPQEILDVCRRIGDFTGTPPRNPARCTLSPPDPCAKVAR
jgi:ADP-heptose:LPS heptosyltransferase